MLNDLEHIAYVLKHNNNMHISGKYDRNAEHWGIQNDKILLGQSYIFCLIDSKLVRLWWFTYLVAMVSDISYLVDPY